MAREFDRIREKQKNLIYILRVVKNKIAKE